VIRVIRLFAVGVATLMAAGGGTAAAAAETVALARRLAAAAPGTGHAELAAVADQVATLSPGELALALAALGDATPAGANWLKSGLDRAVERLGDAITPDALAGLATDRSLPPRARGLAYGWLEARDPERASGLLGAMLDEAALDLRRAAVAKLLDTAAGGDAAAMQAVHRQALVAARDVDQVEAIATWLTEHGEPTDVAEVLGFIRRWRVSDEYDNAGGAGFAKAYPPEQAGGTADTAAWKPIASADKHGAIDLNAAVATKKGVLAYCVAEVEMPAAGLAEVRIGSPCAVVVWVNGGRALEHEIYHASEAIDQYVAAVEFRAGRNTVLVKCCQNEQTEPWAGDWKFQLRITDPLGKPLATQSTEE